MFLLPFSLELLQTRNIISMILQCRTIFNRYRLIFFCKKNNPQKLPQIADTIPLKVTILWLLGKLQSLFVIMHFYRISWYTLQYYENFHLP
jgi:hypothetical protein